MPPLKRFDPTDPSNPPAWGPKAWMPGEDPTPSLPELPSTDQWGLSNAPVKKWTNANLKDLLSPPSLAVKYSDVSQDPHGPLPPMGGDQNRLLADAQRAVSSSPQQSGADVPRIGEQRTIQGTTGVWTGATWKQVPDQSASTEPGTFAGGFMKHLLEKEKSTVAALAGGALLAAPVIGGPAAAGIAAAGPALSEIGARGSQAVSGDPVEPVGLGTVLNVASGPAMVYGPGMVARGVAKGAQAVANSPIGQKTLGAATGGGIGGFVGGLVHEPWLGAMLGLKTGTAAGPAIGRAATSVGAKAATAAENLNLGKTFSEIPEAFGATPAEPGAATPLQRLVTAIKNKVSGPNERPPVMIPEPGAVRPSTSQAPPPDPFAGMSQEDLKRAGFPPDVQARMRADAIKNQPPVPPKNVSTAQPSMSTEPSQQPGQLWPYQSDAVQAKIQALRDAVPSASASPSDLMSAYLKSDTSGRVGNFEMDGVQYHEAPGGSSVSTPKTAADIVKEINTSSPEGRMTGQWPVEPGQGGLADIGGLTSPDAPNADVLNQYGGPPGSSSPSAPAGSAFEAEFGSPDPASNSSLVTSDIMARRLARLQQVFGGRQ